MDIPRKRAGQAPPEKPAIIFGKFGGMWHVQFKGQAHTQVMEPVIALARYANMVGLDFTDYNEPPVDDEICEHGLAFSEPCDDCADFQLAGFFGRQMLDLGEGPAKMREAMVEILGVVEGKCMAVSLLSNCTEFSID